MAAGGAPKVIVTFDNEQLLNDNPLAEIGFEEVALVEFCWKLAVLGLGNRPAPS